MSRGTLQCVDGAIDKLLLAFSANHIHAATIFVRRIGIEIEIDVGGRSISGFHLSTTQSN